MESFDKEKAHQDDTQTIRREVSSLQRRLNESANDPTQLSWDTALLIKNTASLAPEKIISCADPDWQQKVETMPIDRAGIRINDVRTVAQIEFVTNFATDRRLAMTYGNRSFHLEPRPTPFDFD
jgi:hypothetical protein